MNPGPRFLYLHGFASSPASRKAVALATHFAGRGVDLELLDLRVPSLEHLRLSEIIRTTAAAIGHSRDRAVLIGSSLGGLAAARLAENDARVAALILLAPAFQLARRWKERIGAPEVARWRAEGSHEVIDYKTGEPARVDIGFLDDVETVDAPNGGWPDVRVPVLIVHGQGDDTVEIDASREFAAGKRHVRLVEVDDGHELAASLGRIAAESDAFLFPFLGHSTIAFAPLSSRD
jgi:pimeloyl-ACP methyl ester carboxylesterase